MLLQKQRNICIKVYVIQSSGPLSDSTVLDETWDESWLELVINPFMLLHCCGRLILSVLGTQTLGITQVLSLHQNHTYTDLPLHLFGLVSQSYLKCCLLGCSPHFAPSKT